MPGNILGAMNTIVNKSLTSQNLDSRFWSFLDVRVPFKYIQIENSVFLILFLSFFFFFDSFFSSLTQFYQFHIPINGTTWHYFIFNYGNRSPANQTMAFVVSLFFFLWRILKCKWKIGVLILCFFDLIFMKVYLFPSSSLTLLKFGQSTSTNLKF